jgi:Fic family protein
LKPDSEKSFLKAHGLLMKDLMERPGKYRSHGVGIFQGTRVTHIAPPAIRVPELMGNLFNYLKNADELTLIKSCVFHYEMEFIHPFSDGNGRMGRLWQTLILMQNYPVFGYLPFETLINQTQQDYYKALEESDKAGSSTTFIEYMLNVIDISLGEMLNFSNRILTDTDRLEYFISLDKEQFNRKEYMLVFKDISTATASRDLKKGVEMNLFRKTGNKNATIYTIIK